MSLNSSNKVVEIVIKAKAFLEKEIGNGYVFHNINHTSRVAQQVLQFSKAYHLNIREQNALVLAAWLHDTGYLKGPKDHEYRSKQLASSWMNERFFPEEDIILVCELIMSTQISQNPKTLLECCICDADLEHLYRGDYFATTLNLISEWKWLLNKNTSDLAFLDIQINFLESHTFKTDYARHHYRKNKDYNLSQLVALKKDNPDIAQISFDHVNPNQLIFLDE